MVCPGPFHLALQLIAQSGEGPRAHSGGLRAEGSVCMNGSSKWWSMIFKRNIVFWNCSKVCVAIASAFKCINSKTNQGTLKLSAADEKTVIYPNAWKKGKISEISLKFFGGLDWLTKEYILQKSHSSRFYSSLPPSPPSASLPPPGPLGPLPPAAVTRRPPGSPGTRVGRTPSAPSRLETWRWRDEENLRFWGWFFHRFFIFCIFYHWFREMIQFD